MTPEQIKQYLQDHTQDFIIYRTQEELAKAGDDPNKKANALKEIARIISIIPDQTKRTFYQEHVTSTFKLSKKLISFEINENIKYLNPGDDKQDDNQLRITDIVPKECYDDYVKFGFYEENNRYMFVTKEGVVEQSNFTIKPLYHLYSKIDNKRLIEITNCFKHTKICDIPSKNFVSVDLFQQTVINEGNYLFSGSKYHFYRVLNKIMNNFPIANELKTLGWQREGFYAFANGIFSVDHINKTEIVDDRSRPVGTWKPVDLFGIVDHEGEKYFSPSHSCVYSGVREDDDEYENDRSIVYKPCKLNFKEWTRLMLEVYGDKARIAIAFFIAALFRDCIYDKYKMFPHLYLFGEKQSGKSQLAWSLSNLCNYSLPPFNLNSGTQVGFFRRLARVRNGIAWYDECTNNIDEKRHQALKSAYDGVGHEKGKMTKDNRTEITKVASAVIISGQYLPTKDDNALFTRSILLSFEKKVYTDVEMEQFNRLKAFEENGITSILTEILPFRAAIDKKYGVMFSEVFDGLKSDLQKKHADFEERLLRNFTTILTPFKILSEAGLQFGDGVDYDSLYNQCIQMIPELSAQISSSEALATFWNMVDYLFEEGKIIDNTDFKVETAPLEGEMLHKNGVKERVQLGDAVRLLYIRFSKIHPLYMEFHRRQTGTNGVDMVSLKHYIHHHPAFLGQKDSHRFDSTVSSCYVFKYKELGINLERFVNDSSYSSPTNTDEQPSAKRNESSAPAPF